MNDSEIMVRLQYLATLREDLSNKKVNLKALIYGESGFGKTVASMQLAQLITPPDKTIEFIDFLEGWASLRNHPGLTDRSSRQRYDGLAQLEFLALAINRKIAPFENIGTIIVDELSGIAKSDLDVVMKAEISKDPSKDENTAPAWPEFNINTQRMRKTITALMRADVNLIFVAHIREDKDEKTGKIITRPAFMPAFSDIFRQMLHLVAHLSATEAILEDGTTGYKRLFQVHPTNSISAKTRIGGLPVKAPAEILFPAIVQWMKGEREEEVLSSTGENVVKPDPVSYKVTELDDVSISVD